MVVVFVVFCGSVGTCAFMSPVARSIAGATSVVDASSQHLVVLLGTEITSAVYSYSITSFDPIERAGTDIGILPWQCFAESAPTLWSPFYLDSRLLQQRIPRACGCCEMHIWQS